MLKKIGQTTFLSFMPWNNHQGFRVYVKTLKYKNIIALNIIIQSNFPPKNNLFNFFNLNSVE